MAHEPDAHPDPIPLRPIPDVPSRPELAPSPSLGDIPRPPTSLIGRDAEIANAIALLAGGQTRLVTLIGPGGVGKTRLALRVAEETAWAFPDGVVFVALTAITSPALVLPAIARALGVREAGTRPAADSIADALCNQRLLLVLDNFEQVRPAATDIAALLAACPGPSVLVTSRAPLRIAGEQRFPVAPLALPAWEPPSTQLAPAGQLATIEASPAVQLFVSRGQAVDPTLRLDAETAPAIAAICRRLDGLPLAIELAAARSYYLTPADLLARLSPALPLLTGGPDDAPDRLRTMRDAVAWSFDLLTPDEQALFRRLAYCAGGFTLDAAAAIATPSNEPVHPADAWIGARAIDDLVASLVETSLVRRIEAIGATRYGMLEPIREFGLEQLAASGENEIVAARHAAWCVSFAEAARRSGRLSQRGGLLVLEVEHPNLRAALSWLLAHDDTVTAMHLAGELAEFWFRHGHQVEGEAWLERALAADIGAPTAVRAEALAGLSMLQWPRLAFEQAARLLDDAERVARAAGDPGTLAYVRLHQGYVAVFRGDFALAQSRGEELLATYEAIPQGFGRHAPLWLLARAWFELGDDQRAAEGFAALLASGRVAGDDVSVANGLHGLAALAARQGAFAHAIDGYADAAATCQLFGDRLHASLCLHGAAVCAAKLGQPEATVRLIAAANSLGAAVGASTYVYLNDRLSQGQPLSEARAALGEERFAVAWDAGAALSFDDAVAAAKTLVDPPAIPPLAQTETFEPLTAREQEVLRLLVRGWSDKEIAAALGVSRRTAASQVASIRAKLDAPSRTAAAAIAVRDRLV